MGFQKKYLLNLFEPLPTICLKIRRRNVYEKKSAANLDLASYHDVFMYTHRTSVP